MSGHDLAKLREHTSLLEREMARLRAERDRLKAQLAEVEQQLAAEREVAGEEVNDLVTQLAEERQRSERLAAACKCDCCECDKCR